MANTTTPEAGGKPGSVGNPGLLVAVELNGINGFSGAMVVDADERTGRLYFAGGQLLHAEAEGATGEEAFRRILSWPHSRYTLQADERAPLESLTRTLDSMLREARGQPPSPGPQHRPPTPPHDAGHPHPPAPAPVAPPLPSPRPPGPAAPLQSPDAPPVRAPARADGPLGVPRRTLAVAGIAIALAFGGIVAYGVLGTPAAPVLPPPAAPIAPEVLFRIGGGKSFAAELAPNLASAYLASLQVKDVEIVKEGPNRTLVRGTQAGGAPVAIGIEGMATPKGFDGLAEGALDVAMAGRRIKPEWQQKLAAFGTMTAPGFEHVVALSGIAVIVHPSNGIAQLDKRQLAAIFSGAVTDWSQVGGSRAPIHVYAGDEQMGMTDLFRSLVLGKGEYAPAAKRLETILAVNDAVAQDLLGIGYVTLPFVRGTRALPISEGSERPHVPTPFTLASEDYYLTHRCYFYAVPRPARPHLLKFLQFALGAEGQAVVKKSGFVELSVTTVGDAPPPWAPADYRRLVSGAKKLTSTFRFETDSATFDTRALVDVERVTAFLVENRLSGSAVKVLGFTDSKGKPERNRELSLARAEQVKQALEQRGIDGVSVSGFGAAMPVASNETEEGRQRNRRVELWVER